MYISTSPLYRARLLGYKNVPICKVQTVYNILDADTVFLLTSFDTIFFYVPVPNDVVDTHFPVSFKFGKNCTQ